MDQDACGSSPVVDSGTIEPMTATMRGRHGTSLADSERYWAEAALSIDWDVPFARVLDVDRPPFARWFVGGRLNTCHNAIDRHVDAGRGEQLAFIHDSPLTGTVRKLTYRELRDEVARRDDLKGELPLGLLVLKQGASSEERVVDEVISLVRERVGPVASFRRAVVVSALPKTRSGKTLRRTLRQIANGDPWEVPATTEDATVLDGLAALLAMK